MKRRRIKRWAKVKMRHWYRLHVGECPVCGRAKTRRERVYGEPPANPRERYVVIPDDEAYDHCDQR
ncbi:MAG: hypothetical protein ACREJC_13850 [Tepidisphaeraceae bacterium]